MSKQPSDRLAIKMEFESDTSALNKATGAFKAAVLARRALRGIAKSQGDAQDFKIHWSAFDGDDVDAQPIYVALIEAYEHGKEDALTADRAEASRKRRAK